MKRQEDYHKVMKDDMDTLDGTKFSKEEMDKSQIESMYGDATA